MKSGPSFYASGVVNGGKRALCRNGCNGVGADLFGITLAFVAACAQPEHACVLFGALKRLVRGNARLYLRSSNRSVELCCYRCKCIWVGVLIFEAWCDMNRACCQELTGVCAKLVVPSDDGLL